MEDDGPDEVKLATTSRLQAYTWLGGSARQRRVTAGFRSRGYGGKEWATTTAFQTPRLKKTAIAGSWNLPAFTPPQSCGIFIGFVQSGIFRMSSGRVNDRDRQVLGHIARYRLSFKEVLRCLYFDDIDPQKSLDNLRHDEFIVAEKLFKGNRSAYQLAPKGAAFLGLNRRRGEPLGSEALPTHFAIFGFCHLNGRPRIKLEDDEIAALFNERPPPGRYHCLERSRHATRIYHVYVPGDSTKLTDIVSMTRAHVAEVIQTPAMLPWLANQVYSHVILVESNERAELIKTSINKAKFGDRTPLREVAHIRVECVPGYNELENSLYELV